MPAYTTAGGRGVVSEFSRQNHRKSTTSRASQHFLKYFLENIKFKKKTQVQAHRANLGFKIFGGANFSFGGASAPPNPCLVTPLARSKNIVPVVGYMILY